MMLKKAVKFKDVVALMLLHANVEQKLHIPHWDEEHWQLIEDLNYIMEPSVDSIRILEGDKYPTQNLILLALFFFTTRINERKQQIINAGLQNEVFYQVLIEFEKEINLIWNDMPQETLIASCLDPRFKSLKHVRATEHEEAWNCLKAEYFCPEFFNKHNEVQIKTQSLPNNLDKKRKFEQIYNTFSSMDNEIIQKSEFDRYRELPPISVSDDPLLWWKNNESSYPVLAQIAKIYLAIPASQATCERSFSTAKRICTSERTSLTASHISQYVFAKQNANELYED